MKREEAHALMSALVCGTHKECSSNHYRDVALGIDKIYDAFENRSCLNCVKGLSCPIFKKVWKDKLKKDGYLISHKEFDCRFWESRK